MDKHIKIFEDLKIRAEKLRYKDKNEQDDLVRKTQMYVTNCFKYNASLLADLREIKFQPLYAIGNPLPGYYENAWEEGRQKLVNFLDTRIEELKLNPTSVEKVIEKVVETKYVQDTSKIQQLQAEIQGLKSENSDLTSKKRLYNRIDWSWFSILLVALIGGAYELGQNNGKTNYDKEKNQLYEEKQSLKRQVDSLKALKTDTMYKKRN